LSFSDAQTYLNYPLKSNLIDEMQIYFLNTWKSIS